MPVTYRNCCKAKPNAFKVTGRCAVLTILCVLIALQLAAVDKPCKITTAINPPSATADHTAAPPGNEAQFSASSTVEGNCPMIPDIRGDWSSSDPDNIAISGQSADQALAVCLHSTSQPVTIRYSGRIRGRAFPTATLVCK